MKTIMPNGEHSTKKLSIANIIIFVYKLISLNLLKLLEVESKSFYYEVYIINKNKRCLSRQKYKNNYGSRPTSKESNVLVKQEHKLPPDMAAIYTLYM